MTTRYTNEGPTTIAFENGSMRTVLMHLTGSPAEPDVAASAAGAPRAGVREQGHPNPPDHIHFERDPGT